MTATLEQDEGALVGNRDILRAREVAAAAPVPAAEHLESRFIGCP